MSNDNFNPDRLITHPRTLGEVYEKESRAALITECCNMAIGPDCRYCPKCGQEARVEPTTPTPERELPRLIECPMCEGAGSVAEDDPDIAALAAATETGGG